MIKASLLLMAVLTVLIAMGLRWRKPAPPPAPAGRGARAKVARPSLFARGKANFDRWVTAAALAALTTIAIMGGLHWLRVVQQ